MEKYQFTDNMGEISGLGGGYESGCRKMVVAGLEWLDAHPEAVISYQEYKHIYGMTANESPDCEAMQSHMNKAIDNEATGAMMQACTGHVMYAHKNGWDKYVSELEKRDEKTNK
jgi:hypothetical protein